MSLNVKDIIDHKLIDLDLNASNKKEAISRLAQLLAKQNYIVDQDLFVKDVYLREEEGITGMGNNVAIPHGKSAGVLKPCLAIGKTSQLIEWESYDETPVVLIFLFAVPANQEGVTIHLKLLSQVAAKLADESTLKQLKDEDDVERFIKILSR